MSNLNLEVLFGDEIDNGEDQGNLPTIEAGKKMMYDLDGTYLMNEQNNERDR